MSQVALIRIDLNIPIGDYKHPKVMTMDKILRYYTTKYKKIILCSHLGQPQQREERLSFKRLLSYLIEETGFNIHLLERLSRPKEDGIYLLENLRFDPREIKGCFDFAHELASIADRIYFEALACCHRKHTSVYHLLQSPKTSLGFFAKKELKNWKAIQKEQDVLYLIGGAKAKTKIPFIEKLSLQHPVYIFGALSHCYLKDTHNLGASYIPNYSIQGQKLNLNTTLPRDFLWLSSDKGFYYSEKPREPQDIIVDIGKSSLETLKDQIGKSKLVVWLGPSCWFEKITSEQVSSITQLTEFMSDQKKDFFIGGGETAQAILLQNPELKDKIFDAGGALLAYLSDSPVYLK